MRRPIDALLFGLVLFCFYTWVCENCKKTFSKQLTQLQNSLAVTFRVWFFLKKKSVSGRKWERVQTAVWGHLDVGHHSSQMVGWREQKDIRVWSKKVLGLYVMVPESFARSERLVYLLIGLMTPRERWGGARETADHLLFGQASEQGSAMALLSAYRT